MRYKSLALFITIALLIFSPIYAFASPDGKIEMQAEVGFDDHFQLGQWIPVSVYIENTGADIKGEIEVIGNQDSSTAISFTAPAVIPKGSKKRIDLYVLMNTLQKNIDIDLISDGKLLKRHSVDSLIPMSKSSFLMGILTDDQSGLNYWWEKQSGDRLFTKYEPVALNANDIPSKKEVMNNFSMLIIDDFDTSKLSSAQKKSILDWTEEGGILLIGTGRDGIKTLKGLSSELSGLGGGETFTDKNPTALTELADIQIPADMSIELMNLDSDDTWMTVAGEDSTPYIIMKQQGRGYIFISSFGLGKQPIAGWTGSKAIWESIFGQHLTDQAFMMLKDPQSRDKFLGDTMHHGIFEALANIKEMEPPSAKRLISILLIYLVIVGPINYFILKKIDKRELAWLTIPLLVVIFSLGIYGLGSRVKGNDVVSNVISLVEPTDNMGARRIKSYTGIFIPERGDYKFSTDGDYLLVPARARDYYAHRPDNEGTKRITAKVFQGANPKTELFNLNMWTMEPFTSRYYLEDFGDIKGELSYRDGHIIGTIENNTNSPLEDITVMTNLGYHKVGNLARGAKKDIDFKVIDSAKTISYPERIRDEMLLDLYPDDLDEAHFKKRSLIRELVPQPMHAVARQDVEDIELEAMVFGFSDHKLGGDIYIDGSLPKKTYRTNLILDKINVSTSMDGKVTILPGMIRAKVDAEKSEYPDSYEASNDIYEIFLYDSKRAVFYFEMDNFEHIDIENLAVYIGTVDGRLPDDNSILIEVYDKEESGFVDDGVGLDIDIAKGKVEIDPSALERYTDEENKLYIRIGLGENIDRDIIINTPTIGIEGRKK